MTAIIRPAVMADAPKLAMLFDGYRVFYKKQSDQSAAEQFITDRLRQQDSNIYVAVSADGDLVGFVQLYPLYSSTRMAKLWLLNDLYVSPGDRGKGISLRLIERAKQLVTDTGACGMYLETGIDNDIGNKLYPRAGLQLNEDSNFYTWMVE